MGTRPGIAAGLLDVAILAAARLVLARHLFGQIFGAIVLIRNLTLPAWGTEFGAEEQLQLKQRASEGGLCRRPRP